MQSGTAERPQSPAEAPKRRPRKSPPTAFALSSSALVGLYFIQRYRFLTCGFR